MLLKDWCLTVSLSAALTPLLLVSLAGTPVQNNMVELFGLLSFMYPDIFTAIGPFEAAFNLTKGQVSADLAV